jgi:hypothetical protein
MRQMTRGGFGGFAGWGWFTVRTLARFDGGALGRSPIRNSGTREFYNPLFWTLEIDYRPIVRLSGEA